MTRRKSAAGMVLLALISTVLAAPVMAQAPLIDNSIAVGNQTVRYLSAGSAGDAIILLHGWPQSADEFRDIMPQLALNYRVYAPDLSGVGGTSTTTQRWDKASLAADVKAFADHLGLEDPLVVGHDIGGMVAYAYARKYPEDLSGVAILDVPIPGLDPADAVASSPHAWHYDFHNQVGLAEALVDGQQADYFAYFIAKVAANADAVSPEDIAVYAEAYGSPDRLRAGFEFYRAFEADAAFFQAQNRPFDLPMLVVGAEYSTASLLPVMQQSFAAHGATQVETQIIEGSGHWLSEEQPEATGQAVLDFAAAVFAQ